LTTRFPHLARDLRAKDFALDEMNENQAMALMALAFGRALTSDERPDAKRLIQIVGGHPFALQLAATRVKEGVQWAQLLRDLDDEIARLAHLIQGPGTIDRCCALNALA
jgi:hypothetical protein